MSKPTKNQSSLLTALGSEYMIKSIDLEPCIYRRLNDHYDFEISGTRIKGKAITVYVWDILHGCGNGARMIEKYTDIKTAQHLKAILDQLTVKYSSKRG